MTLARERLQALFDHPNVKAFYAVVRRGESSLGAQAYTMISGGGSFSDFTRHPFAGLSTKQGGRAAGAPQFIPSTWQEIAERYSLPDFSPASQDLGYVGCLLKRSGAIEALLAGRFEEAVRICRPEWTSLPGASENNPAWNMDKARALYLDNGGKLDNEELLQAAAPIEDRSPTNLPPVQPKESSMPLPLLAIVSAISTWGPTIAALIPQVATLFDRDKATPAKLEAAQAVVTKIVETTGAVNTEAAIGAITSDSAMLEKVRSAVITAPEIMPYVVVEVGPGIEKTQAANLAAQNAERGFWRNPAFWFVMTAVVPPLYGVVGVLLWRMPAPSEQLVTQVVTGILGLAAVAGAYYLGSTQNSAQKTAIIANQANKT
jgi:muramidase (phage lysozyme)